MILGFVGLGTYELGERKKYKYVTFEDLTKIYDYVTTQQGPLLWLWKGPQQVSGPEPSARDKSTHSPAPPPRPVTGALLYPDTQKSAQYTDSEEWASAVTHLR